MTHTMEQHEIRGLGFHPRGFIARNLSLARLYEEALRRRECAMGSAGQILVKTGKHTGRSAQDKFAVDDQSTRNVIWWGNQNRSLDTDHYNVLRDDVLAHLAQKDLFVFDGYAGADPEHRLRVRVITTTAWHCLFARNMLIPEDDADRMADFEPEFTLYHGPEFQCEPGRHGTRSETVICANYREGEAIVAGTWYAGEIKKTVFTIMNKLLPEKGVLSMHCSANYGKNTNDVALFFGLSGTGKTTLSTDDERTLIGDDEHGWSDRGVFNIEGGCYAKVINLSPSGEPQIYAASRRFGSILENVMFDENTREIDWASATITENTRSSYPVTYLDAMDESGVAGHPKHVVFLTADAFGVLPPIAKLDTAQAMYHFLSGYTAKLAGTELGVKEPTPNFSTCFGAPFLPLPPARYAELFGRYVDKYKPKLWLVNTGWTGGAFGTGTRMSLAHTRRLVRAALGGELNKAEFRVDPTFRFKVPTKVQGVPAKVLDPRKTWPDGTAYDVAARDLALRFAENFKKFADGVSDKVKKAGPAI